MALQEQPLATYKILAERLEVTPPTVKARMNNLIHKINPNVPLSEGTIVSADLDPSALEMEIVDVLLTTKSHGNVRNIEEVIRAHPYSLYYIRRFGPSMGLFAQFRQPYSTRPALYELLSNLEDARLLENYRVLDNLGNSIRTLPKLSAWRPESMMWEFDWNSWQESFESADEVFTQPPPKRPNGPLLHRLQPIDIGLLTLFTQNARRKQKEMLERLPKVLKHPEAIINTSAAKRKFHRRYQFVQENLIADYRVHLDWKVLDIHHTALFVCRASRKLVSKLFNHLSKFSFPFSSLLKLRGQDEFSWYVRTTPSHFAKLVDFLWERCNELQIHFLDYTHSEFFYLWPETWDFDSRSWKVSAEFLNGETLERARIQI